MPINNSCSHFRGHVTVCSSRQYLAIRTTEYFYSVIDGKAIHTVNLSVSMYIARGLTKT